MAKELTKKQFIEILLDKKIREEKYIKIFQTIYSSENNKAYASDVGRSLGYTKNPHGVMNLAIGRLGKKVAEKHNIDLSKRESGKDKYWDLFFNNAEYEGNFFPWQLKPNLIEALEKTGLESTLKRHGMGVCAYNGGSIDKERDGVFVFKK